jgi:hypothetical protein
MKCEKAYIAHAIFTMNIDVVFIPLTRLEVDWKRQSGLKAF